MFLQTFLKVLSFIAGKIRKSVKKWIIMQNKDRISYIIEVYVQYILLRDDFNVGGTGAEFNCGKGTDTTDFNEADGDKAAGNCEG
jgi:hypothetical protein